MSARAKAEKLRSASAAYDRYQEARARILPMVEPWSAHAGDLTTAERELLAELEDLWTAGPEAIADLRRYGKAISGVRRSNYKGDRAELVRARLNRDRLKLLDNSDPGLWVDEPPALGGFGLRDDAAFYNEDTLRSFRIVSLLHDAALLHDLRSATVRTTVWDIGGGWGGFAYYLKTLFPNVTYLITAPPGLLLLSATYVMTLFPAARVRFFAPSHPQAFWSDWDTTDFAFAPDTLVGRLTADRIALTIDIGMLERLSRARAVTHVQQAFDSKCRYVLSVCGEDDQHGVETVRAAVERFYWLHPMSAPAYLDRRFSVRRGAFLLGWKRIHA